MHLRFYRVRVVRSVFVLVMLLSSGCYKRPTAERLNYDSQAVETLRKEIESVDWNE